MSDAIEGNTKTIMANKKKIKINEQVSKKATSCSRNKVCLEHPEEVCPVISNISEGMIFVSKKNVRSCPYYVPFGYDGFCNCPVRQEIYNKYNK